MVDTQTVLVFRSNYLFIKALEYCQDLNFEVTDSLLYGHNSIIFYDKIEALLTINTIFLQYGHLPFCINL